MPADFSTAAIEAASAVARVPVFTFPESFASLLKDRVRHPLGTYFGITNFGVNLAYLPPGSVSAPRHFPSHQDEFVYILEGTLLVTSAGEMPLRPGMCAGDVVTYPDDDIKIDKMPDGRLRVVRKDGSPY